MSVLGCDRDIQFQTVQPLFKYVQLFLGYILMFRKCEVIFYYLHSDESMLVLEYFSNLILPIVIGVLVTFLSVRCF